MPFLLTAASSKLYNLAKVPSAFALSILLRAKSGSSVMWVPVAVETTGTIGAEIEAMSLMLCGDVPDALWRWPGANETATRSTCGSALFARSRLTI